MDSATAQLLSAISSWRPSHSRDPNFGAIDTKLTSLEDDLKGDADGDLKGGSAKPSFPNAQNFGSRMAAAKSARGAATAQ